MKRINVQSKPFFLLLSVVFIILFVTPALISQYKNIDKANYDLAEKFTSENLRNMVFDTEVRPNWLKNSNNFWYKYKTSRGTFFYIVNPEKRIKKPLFDNAKMAALLTRETGTPYDAKHHPVESVTFVKNNTAIQFTVDKVLYEYDLASEVLSTKGKAPEEVEKPDWASFSPDEKTIVFAKNHDLYMMSADDPDSTEYRLTTDGELLNSYARKDDVTEKDKRMKAIVYWSKDSKKFAFARTDVRKVPKLWLINCLSEPRPTLETYIYSMPGEKNIPQHSLYVFDRNKRTRVTIDTEKWKDQALFRAESSGVYRTEPYLWWGENSDKLYFARRSRDHHKVDFCCADTETGESEVLIEERTNTYMEKVELHVINNGDELIQWSERDGWGHFYLYDGKGNLKNGITSGAFTCDEAVKIDVDNRVLYFTACGREQGEDPYYMHLYKVNLDGSDMALLNPGNAEHSAVMSESGEYFVDNFSRVDMTPRSVLRDNNGKIILDLETADLSLLFDAGFKFAEPFKVKSADGITDLYGVMYKPFDFRDNVRYPIIAYVYPGPQTESVPKAFSRSLGNVALSQFGFIVVCVGNRGGSPQRSKWYHNYGYGNFRDYGLADKKAALEQLGARHPFINIDKVGIFGHSGGGFMSTAAMLVYPDFFKVAVSSSGNHDNVVFDLYWNERHNGVKRVVDKEGNVSFEFDVDINSELAKNLKGHLLLVTGDMDNNVHHANTFRVANALIKANKRFDLFVFPGKRHGYGDMSDYFFWLRSGYFCKYLIGDYQSSIDIPQLHEK